MKLNISRRSDVRASAGLVTALLVGCSTWIIPGNPDLTELDGHVVVKWIGSDSREDRFIYQKQDINPLRFRASFMTTDIVPPNMYTTGGSIPRVFWGIPSLSPWGLAPAYIIHDWIFEVHRCQRSGYPEVAAITFEQSAQILAEAGQELIDVGLIKTDKLDEIVWGVRTRYARKLWDQPGTEKECKEPGVRAMATAKPMVDFKIPRGRRLTSTESTHFQTGCMRVFRAPTQYRQETVAICRIVTSL